MPDSDIGTFEPPDLAYEAYVADCLSCGIDPDSGDPIGFAHGYEWTLEDIPFEDIIPSDEDIPF